MRVMSLDASTSTIGLAILDYVPDAVENIKLIHCEYFKPPKTGSIFERLSVVKRFILDNLHKYNPNEFAIEEYIQYMKGGSGAKTIIPLAIFNRTIGFTYYEKTNKEPIILNVMKIRHAIKLDKELPPKEDIPELVAKRLNIDFPYFTKINKKTGEEKVIEESYDVADAIAVGLAHIILKSSEGRKRLSKKK